MEQEPGGDDGTLPQAIGDLMATTTGTVDVTIQVGTASAGTTGGQTISWATYWTGSGRLRHSRRSAWRAGGAGEVYVAPYVLVFDAHAAPSLGNNYDLYRVLIGSVYYNVIEAAEYDRTVQLWLEVQR